MQAQNTNLVQKFGKQILYVQKMSTSRQLKQQNLKARETGPSRWFLYGKYCQKSFVSLYAYGNNKTSQF